jgi:hypothetical protein
MGLVLSFEERKYLANFFVVLIKTDKRVQANEKKSKKRKKAQAKHHEIGSRIRGPLFFCPLLYPWIKNINQAVSHDRHHSFAFKY